MKEELVNVDYTYDREGFLIKLTANDVPLFVPHQEFPSVEILWEDVEWVQERKLMSKEQFTRMFRNY